ncbi:MAG: sulfatase-like hydrolase/transferase, partial [Phycisphaerae bacterium]|nr:sulfatase-like hydrolase/transferase [Gammaproteobacteria bacterium]NIU55024.1 sulfatase-like hydrolase/transferase [Phycisphaerae bacterium]
HADHQIGRLMGYLHRDGLWDETTLIVTADHGMTQTDPENCFSFGWLPEANTLDILADAGIEHWMFGTGGTSGFIWLEDVGDLD